MNRRLRMMVAAMGGAGETVAWEPTQAIEGVTPALWLVADDIAGNDGDLIASWVSKEGNSYDFAQASDASKPIIKKGANGINGHNVARFVPNDYLKYAAADISSATEGTLFIIYRINTAQNNECLFSSADEAGLLNYWFTFGLYKTADPNMMVYQFDNDVTSTQVRGNTDLVINTPYLGVWKSDGSVYTLRMDGGVESLTIESGTNNGDWIGDTSGRDNFALGALVRSSIGFYFNGDIAELILYDKALSTDSIETIETYLS